MSATLTKKEKDSAKAHFDQLFAIIDEDGKDERCTITIDFENTDQEEYEDECWSDYDNLGNPDPEKYPNIWMDDIRSAFENDQLEILEYIDEWNKYEVIGFRALVKTDTHYIALRAYDDLSPNRWYNGIGEGHLDREPYTVYVEGTYSINDHGEFHNLKEFL